MTAVETPAKEKPLNVQLKEAAALLEAEGKTDYEIRQELKALSLEVAGGPNRWNKMLKRGYVIRTAGLKGVRTTVQHYYTETTLLAHFRQIKAEIQAAKDKAATNANSDSSSK